MKVLIVNQHSSNFGDDAAGTALVGLLLKHKEISKIDFIYHANQAIPIDDEKVNHNLDIGSFRKVGLFAFIRYYFFEKVFSKEVKNLVLRKWILIIRNADVVFVAPGGANIGVYKDWIYLLRILMVIAEGKTPIFFYNTVGRSGNCLFDFLAKKALRKSKMFVRERASENFLKSIGITCGFGPDTAFALEQRNTEIRTKTIVFVPTYLSKWHPDFYNTEIDTIFQRKTLFDLANWIKDNDFEVEILPHLCLDYETEYNLLIQKLLIQYGVNKVVVRNDIKSIFSYDEAISTSRLVIGMRYHSIVLAAKNARPFVSLCYENKMNEVCKYVGMEKYAFNMKSLLNDTFIDISTLLDDVLLNEQLVHNKLNNFVRSDIRKVLDIPIQEAIDEYKDSNH